MPQSDQLTRARLLPNGAAFHRCALQVNPHHYAATFRGENNVADGMEYEQLLVEKALESNVSVLAITDHNSVSSVAAFRAAAHGRGVHVFPGFELVSSEGVHVLCIYPQDTAENVLERHLGEFGISNPAPSSDLASMAFLEILERVPKQGGITIAAHTSNKGGLFKVLLGKARIRAWRSPYLQAIQIPGQCEELPQDIRPIVENTNPDYKRDNVAGEKLAVAVLNAKDVATLEDLDEPTATCLIKMSDVSIEGLRQAFLDPESRIRLNSTKPESEVEEHSELIALAWEGGFLDGAALHLNANLNVLVGGRGTGKSTIIESIRAVLGLNAIGDEAQKAYQGIVRHVLGNGTKISLLVRTCRPASREFRIERTIPNPAIVRNESGAVSNLSPQDVLPGLEVYGQHEISELAKSAGKRTRLLDRFVDREEAAGEQLASVRRHLESNRKSLLEVMSAAKETEERIEALPGLEETIERFREAGLEERLSEKSLLVREERVLVSVPERLAPFRDCLEILQRELPIDRAFISVKALEDLPGREIIEKLPVVLTQLEERLARLQQELVEALAAADLGIEAVRGEWRNRKQAVESEYEKILRELQKSRVDGEEFIRLRRKIEELRPMREHLQQSRTLVDDLGKQRRELLAEWEDQKAAVFRSLERAAKKVSRKLRERVEVRVTAAGNREPLATLLRDEVGGRLQEAINQLQKRSDLSLPHLVQTCRSGAEALMQDYSIPSGAAERLAEVGPEVLMRIEELELPPTTEIRLNTAPTGEPAVWQSLGQLSTGQKATAILLLLLLDSDAPLIVDQPEDDLDNRFITEGVVPRMRSEKQHRQFVFSTHNANIPVLGDAELIVGLVASGDDEGGQGRVDSKFMGSIDSRPVRELIEEILEGGKDAFERRRRKYGF